MGGVTNAVFLGWVGLTTLCCLQRCDVVQNKIEVDEKTFALASQTANIQNQNEMILIKMEKPMTVDSNNTMFSHRSKNNSGNEVCKSSNETIILPWSVDSGSATMKFSKNKTSKEEKIIKKSSIHACVYVVVMFEVFFSIGLIKKYVNKMGF